MEINTGINHNNHLDDVFMTDIDDHSCQKIISQIEEKRELESIKNSAYNDAFLKVCEQENKEAYDKGFSEGKNYSMKYGQILGRIEAFFSLNNNNLIQASENEIESLESLKKNMENYSGMLTPEILKEFSSKTSSILSRYIKME